MNMKISLVENKNKETPLQTLLKKVKGYKWSEDDDSAELIKKVEGEPDLMVHEVIQHAGDLKPGQFGVDDDGAAYFGCQGAGAYNLDGETRWLPNCGPSVCIHSIGEIVIVEDGAVYPESDEDLTYPETTADLNDSDEKYNDLLEATKSFVEAVKKRLDKGGSAKVDSALEEINKYIGE